MSRFPYCLIILVVSTCGEGKSESGVEACEYEDANLLFPNTLVSSVSDIRAKTWNKENGIRLASWTTNGKFAPSPSYGHRLMAIGENSIKIRNATRADTGTYTLVLTSGSIQVFIESTLHLDVLVPPTIQCSPKIVQEGDTLRAVLPPDDCGIPSLAPSWMSGIHILINGNISVLNFESGLVPGMYTACAIGKSIRCFQEGADKLCSNYTDWSRTQVDVVDYARKVFVCSVQLVSDQSKYKIISIHSLLCFKVLLPQKESSSVSVVGILTVIIFYIVIGVVLSLVCWKWKSIKRKLFPLIVTNEIVYHPGEESTLTKEETAAQDVADVDRTVPDEGSLENDTTPIIDLRDIKRHLIDQYKTMKDVALSPCYEENNIDVSQVYCELEFMRLGIQDKECRQQVTDENVTDANITDENVASENEIFSGIDTENSRPIPALILGECGSGKTTWCKNVVYQWCQYHDHKESNLEMNESSIPDIARFEILLYIPLKRNLEGLSFMELLRNALFSNAADYYEYTRGCILDHREPALLLIDGLDEVTCNREPILSLLKEKTIVPCSIVLTSRTNDLEYLQEKDGISLRLFQIQGMGVDRSKEYARKVFDILCQRHGEKLNVDHFWKFAKHIQVLSMFRIPLMCLSLIWFWINSKAISADLTDVLLTIVEYYLRRAMTRERYKANISKVLEEQHFDISIFIAKTKHIHYLREHGYLLKVISGVAKKLWCLQTQAYTDDEIIDIETDTIDYGNDVELCLETGILIKTFREVLGRKRTQIAFSHTLLFDLFVALSITMGTRDSFRRCITTKNAVIKNSYMIHMLCQVAPDLGKNIIKDIGKIFDKGNAKGIREKTEVSDRKLIFKIECKEVSLRGGAQGKWLQTLMYTDELSNAKLTILTEGLKFTKDLTYLLLKLPENRKELLMRLPILPKLQALQVDIENCTLLLHEEQEWNKVKLSGLGKLVIKSVNVDVKTTGYIIEAVSSCKDLRALELCPKDDLNADIVASGSLKPFYYWGCLAQSIKNMTKLRRVRLHNLQIGEHMPALLNILCSSPTIEILDLMNLKEIGTGEILKLNGSDQGLSACIHHEVTFKKRTPKTLQLIKNAMSEKSWLTLSERLESLSPHILHIGQVHQSRLVLKELLQGIGKCTDLNVLSICTIRAGNEPVAFSVLRPLQNLTKLTLCKITMPDSSWKELSDVLVNLTKLKDMSLACLETQNCFIAIQKIPKVRLLTMREIHLKEALWSKLGDEVMTLPKLKKLELISCKMSQNGWLLFLDKMNQSAFHVERAKTSQIEDSEMLYVDMIITSKKKT